MDRNTQNEKKRHHYVPIAYLDKFADGTGKIFAYRKDEVAKVLHLRPSEIAFERYYYSQPSPEGGRDNRKLEDYFSTIEATWTPLVTRLRSRSSAHPDLVDLYTFMGLMRVRVPAARDMVEAFLSEQVKATVRQLDRQGKLPPKPPGLENILDHMIVPIDPHQSLLAMPPIAKGFGMVVNDLALEIIHNETDVSFLTSDNPVIYFNPTVDEAKVLPYQVKPPRGPIELLFPIDANIVLRGRTGPAGLRHVNLTDRQTAKRINRFVARFGYRFIFSCNRNHDALIARYAGISPVLKTMTVSDEAGGFLLLPEYVFGTRPTKPKWDEDKARNHTQNMPRDGAIDLRLIAKQTRKSHVRRRTKS